MPPKIIVDIDSHVLEPTNIWEENIEPEYRDRALRLKTDENGLEYLQVNGVKPRGHFIQGGLLGRDCSQGKDLERRMTPGMVTYDEALRALPAASDPGERIKILDAEGIDVSILYPTLGLSWEPECDDPKLAAAYARVYNDWIVGFCSSHPDRLAPIAHITTRDVDESVRELKRSIRAGAKGAMLLSTPFGGRAYGDGYYDPLWAEAEALDVPVGLHVWGNPDHAGSNLYPGLQGPEMAWWIGSMLAIDVIVGFTSLLNGAVFDRFPALKIVVLETGGGWIQYWLERIDSQYGVYGFKTPMKEKPSEYFRRQCWLSLDPDTALAADIVRFLGADRCMWAGDFPHADSGTSVVAELNENLSSLSEEDRLKVLGGNAVKLYGL